MAVIEDYVTETGCRIIVHDDCIRPPEEVEQIIKNVSRIVLEQEKKKLNKATDDKTA